jgi:hypothetical protein
MRLCPSDFIWGREAGFLSRHVRTLLRNITLTSLPQFGCEFACKQAMIGPFIRFKQNSPLDVSMLSRDPNERFRLQCQTVNHNQFLER